MATKEEAEALSDYWQQQIETWQSSDQTQKAFCKMHHLNYHRFGYWRRKFLDQTEQEHCPGVPGFVPVTVSPTPVAAGLAIRLPSGLVVQGIATDNLPLVYQLLSRLS